MEVMLALSRARIVSDGGFTETKRSTKDVCRSLWAQGLNPELCQRRAYKYPIRHARFFYAQSEWGPWFHPVKNKFYFVNEPGLGLVHENALILDN